MALIDSQVKYFRTLEEAKALVVHHVKQLR